MSFLESAGVIAPVALTFEKPPCAVARRSQYETVVRAELNTSDREDVSGQRQANRLPGCRIVKSDNSVFCGRRFARGRDEIP